VRLRILDEVEAGSNGTARAIEMESGRELINPRINLSSTVNNLEKLLVSQDITMCTRPVLTIYQNYGGKPTQPVVRTM